MPKRNRGSSSTTTVSTPPPPPPQLCPGPEEAIRVWAAKTTTGGGGGGRRLSDLAKNHLLATGWTLFQATKSTGKSELQYRSPAGKVFYTLRAACRSVLASSQTPLETTSSPLFKMKMKSTTCESRNKKKKTKKMRTLEDIMKDDRSMMTSGVVAGVLGRPTPVTGRGDLYWTLLKSEESPNKIQRLKLQQALEVMHECFAPCVDPVTHKDVAEDIILNKERDFYTVVLELQADEVVTVATVRVHEEEGGVAEVPLVATASKFQRQGMCPLLMTQIENWLRGIGVSRVVLPSAESALNFWTSEKMGFSIMDEDEVDHLFTAYGDIVDFQGTTVCHKHLLSIMNNINTHDEKCDAAAAADYYSSDDNGSTISHEEEHVFISAADRAIKLRQAHINYY